MAGYSHCRCADYWPAASRTPAAWAKICRARSLESAPCPEREEPPACPRRMQVVQWSKASSYVPPGPRFHYDKFCRECYCRWRALYYAIADCSYAVRYKRRAGRSCEVVETGRANGTSSAWTGNRYQWTRYLMWHDRSLSRGG